jgi:hypothetical protein
LGRLLGITIPLEEPEGAAIVPRKRVEKIRTRGLVSCILKVGS